MTSGGGSVGGRTRPRWSPSSSSVTYTPDQVRALTPYRSAVESRGQQPELRDLFLCHAWDDRRGIATELNALLEAEGVSVWFSEKDILLGQPFMREIDRGLAKSRSGLVLITPALLERVNNRGVSDKELSELLARDQLIPVVHGTTYEEVRKVSPLLGSRHGLDTAEDSMEVVATKIAELVRV
jgi:TIR domain